MHLRDAPKRRSSGETEEVLTALSFLISILLHANHKNIDPSDAELLGHCEHILSKYLKRRRREVFTNG